MCLAHQIHIEDTIIVVLVEPHFKVTRYYLGYYRVFRWFSMRICMNTFNYEQGSQAGNFCFIYYSIWHTLYYELGFQRYYMVIIFQNWHQVKVLFICYPVKKFKVRMQTIRLSSLTMR